MTTVTMTTVTMTTAMPAALRGAMKMLRRVCAVSGVVSVAVLALLLGGCLESTDVTFVEPGVYQGAADPLIGNSDEAALQERIKGQTDR